MICLVQLLGYPTTLISTKINIEILSIVLLQEQLLLIYCIKIWSTIEKKYKLELSLC